MEEWTMHLILCAIKPWSNTTGQVLFKALALLEQKKILYISTDVKNANYKTNELTIIVKQINF